MTTPATNQPHPAQSTEPLDWPDDEQLFSGADALCIDINTVDDTTLKTLLDRAQQSGYRGTPWRETSGVLRLIERYALEVQRYIDTYARMGAEVHRQPLKQVEAITTAPDALHARRTALAALMVRHTPKLTPVGRERLISLYKAWFAGRADGIDRCLAQVQQQLTLKPTTGLLRLWHRYVAPSRPAAVAAKPPSPPPANSPPPPAMAGAAKGAAGSKKAGPPQGIYAALGFNR